VRTPQIRIILATILLAAAFGCQTTQQPNAAAHDLLNAYMDDATGSAAGITGMIQDLDQQQSKLGALKGQVPEAFYDRYERLIATTRLAVAPSRDEHSSQEIAAYVQSVTGTPAPAGENNLTIAAARAFSEEVLRLDMLLDGETNRDKVREKYAERLRSKKKK
jgi:hypothetical protein